MTVGTTNVVAPMFTAPEIVVLFSSSMARQTSFGNLLGRLVLEGDDLLGIAFFSVGFAGTMTRFATRHLPFPTTDCGKLGMRGVGVGLELILVAVLTGFAADIIFSPMTRGFDLFGFDCLRRTPRGDPHKCRGQRKAKKQALDDSVRTQTSASSVLRRLEIAK